MKASIHILSIMAFLAVMAMNSCKVSGPSPSGHDIKGDDSLTINVLGDSYVRNHRRPFEESWHYKVAMMHGMHYNNYGRNGSCVAFDRTNDGFGKSLMVRYHDMDPNADIVVIIAGHNDASMIGGDKLKLSQFTDSVSKLIDNIRHHCPKAKIGWVTPWYVDRDGFGPVVKAIKKICRKKHVPVLDNYRKDCLIQVRDGEFRKQYFQGADDTAHLNAAGHDMFVPVGNKFIEKLIR